MADPDPSDLPLPPSGLGEEIHALFTQARQGDAEAQAELAVRFNNGHGLPKDDDASRFWLLKAAEGGSTWAQTTHAILLRGTREPEKEAQSTQWLQRAAAEGDSRAILNLGTNQMLGIGCAASLTEGLANVMRATFAREPQARELLERVLADASRELIEQASDSFSWPTISFILSRTAPGHLDTLFNLTDEQSRGSPELDRLLEYERQTAQGWFANGALLSPAFGAEVCVLKHHVGLGWVQGERCTSVSVDMSDVRLQDGRRVWWPPSMEALNAAASMLAFAEGRIWARTLYVWH